MRAILRPEDRVAVVDTREQLAFDLSPMRSEVRTLPSGDYSLVGLESEVAIERKSLSDLLGCIGGERERFEREVQRLLAYRSRLVIVECTWQGLKAGQWRSRVTPSAARGSVLGWIDRGLPFCFEGSRSQAEATCRQFLCLVANWRWRELRALMPAADG